MSFIRHNLFLLLALLSLVACGSDDNSPISQNNEEGTVQLYGAKVATSMVKLPTCDSIQVGQLFYVLADEEFQFCSSEGYQSIDLSGIAGKNGVDGKDGKDGSNGKNGSDGEDGSSCSVINNSNGSKTILCEDGTTATVNDGANCTVEDNEDGSYDLTCSGKTVTVRDGKDGEKGEDGQDGVSCLASKSNDSLFLNCNGILDTIVDGKDGENGINCTLSDNGAGTLTQTCGTTSISWPKALCDIQPFDPGTHFCDAGKIVKLCGGITYNSTTHFCDARTSVPMQAWSTHCLVPDHCGTFTDSRETPSKQYKWTKIDSQTWMAENLAYLPSVNTENDKSSTEAKYYVYNYDGTDVSEAKTHLSNDTNYYTTYGVLYNWNAAIMEACPTGWHLPDTSEWNKLVNYIGGNTVAGMKLKSISGWATDPYIGIGTDSYGFSALPAGYYGSSVFRYALSSSSWWSNKNNGGTFAYARTIDYNSHYAISVYGDKNLGFSVRCVKDVNSGN